MDSRIVLETVEGKSLRKAVIRALDGIHDGCAEEPRYRR